MIEQISFMTLTPFYGAEVGDKGSTPELYGTDYCRWVVSVRSMKVEL